MSAIDKNQSNVVSLIKSDAEYIKREIDEANQAFGKSLEHYRNAGERLASVREDLKAKGQREKGVGFQAWVEANCGIKRNQAYKYIALFENWDDLVCILKDTNDIFTLVDALKAIKDNKSTTLQAHDDAYNAVATEVVDEIESNANKKVLEAHKQTDTERKAREKAEKELAKLNKHELALKATQDENKQLLSVVEELQNQIATMQKPEMQTITVIDDSATKELEKVKAELIEKEKHLSNFINEKYKNVESKLGEGAKRIQILEKMEIQKTGIDKSFIKRAYVAFKDNSLGFLNMLSENSDIPDDSEMKKSATILLKLLKEICN